jgi:broad specificity phosphatase PhoE
MGVLVLVRHGQANSQARDEIGYDKLSDLGHQQARWLGDWIRLHEAPFDRVLMGSLRRHQETAQGMGDIGAPPEIDPRLNELDYFNLAAAHAAHNGTQPHSADTFVHHIKDVMEAWHRAEIKGDESFIEFETRIADVLDLAIQPGKRVLCVTSGGVIGMMMRHVLNLDPGRMAHLLVAIRNTSLHRLEVWQGTTVFAGFNATPHLDGADRAFARTEY